MVDTNDSNENIPPDQIMINHERMDVRNDHEKPIQEQSERWNCKECIPNGFKLVGKVKCARSDCFEPCRLESIYCSRDCGIFIGSERLSLFKNQIPLKKQTSNYRKSLLNEYSVTIEQREQHKIRIRNLENRQLFIDDCIERLYLHRQNNIDRQCGYDDRILDYGLSDTLESFPPSMDVPNLEQDSNELPFSVCQYQGRCPMHDGWEIIKSKEVALELQEEIVSYKQIKYKEAHLLLKLSNLKQLKSLDPSH
jgi:hypothetical protein